MKTTSIVMALGIASSVFAAPAMAAGPLVRFDGGIGVDPVSGIAAGAPVLNTVHGVPPGGRPWVIATLKATVKEDGSISVKGRGLVLAGSDAIGTVAAIKFVAASLFCGTQEFDSGAVPISSNGDFDIGGSLGAAPPDPCGTPPALPPVLLIRNATGADGPGAPGAWFAAGIPEE
jgi:hypothetical protein